MRERTLLEERLGSIAKIHRDLEDARPLSNSARWKTTSRPRRGSRATARIEARASAASWRRCCWRGRRFRLLRRSAFRRGGTESCDWARMLLAHVCALGRNGAKFDVEIIEETAGDEAGIKSARSWSRATTPAG